MLVFPTAGAPNKRTLKLYLVIKITGIGILRKKI